MVDLESRQADPDPLHLTSGGKEYVIHGFHRDFFEQLQKLPVRARIEFMNLTPTQLQDYLSARRRDAQDKVQYLLSLKWYWKDSGDEVEFHVDTIPDVHYSVAEMKSKQRSLDTLKKIIEFFEGDNTEVYNKPIQD
jgi:hypothetical protein